MSRAPYIASNSLLEPGTPNGVQYPGTFTSVRFVTTSLPTVGGGNSADGAIYGTTNVYGSTVVLLKATAVKSSTGGPIVYDHTQVAGRRLRPAEVSGASPG